VVFSTTIRYAIAMPVHMIGGLADWKAECVLVWHNCRASTHISRSWKRRKKKFRAAIHLVLVTGSQSKKVAEWRKPSGDSAEHVENRAACDAPLLCVFDEQFINRLPGALAR
jgi:hypothetical protein